MPLSSPRSTTSPPATSKQPQKTPAPPIPRPRLKPDPGSGAATTPHEDSRRTPAAPRVPNSNRHLMTCYVPVRDGGKGPPPQWPRTPLKLNKIGRFCIAHVVDVHLGGAAHTGQFRAERLGDLHGKCADAAAGPVD